MCGSLVNDNLTCIILSDIVMEFMDLTVPIAWAVAMDIGGIPKIDAPQKNEFRKISNL
jgi:hypothetical protein